MKTMTRREQIIKIYQKYIFADGDIHVIYDLKAMYDELLPILDLPLDVPSDKEIERYLWEEINVPLSNQDRLDNTTNYKIYKETFLWIRWAIDIIKNRNK